jgi:hypothetical protein
MSKHIFALVSALALATAACGGATDTDGGAGSSGSGQGGSGVAGKAGEGGSAGSGVSGSAGIAGQAGTAGTAGTAGMGGYMPCEGKTCGQECSPCAPWEDCDSAGPTFCDDKGACQLGMPICSGGPCKSDADCPQVDNGTQGYCIEGTCVYKPLNPCMGLPCGAPCSLCQPGEPCPAVESYCNEQGQCSPEAPACGGECVSPDQCAVPEGPCKQCPNGQVSCPQATCEGGKCGVQYPPCDGEVECKVPEDCPQVDGCSICPDGTPSCVTANCINGKCGYEAPPCKAECSSPQDCPSPKAPCEQCEDGTLSCPTATCEAGVCGVAYEPPCKGVQCKSDVECPAPKGPCQLCADGSAACPVGVCTNGQCGVEFPSCPDLCAPVAVKAEPGCKKQLGFFWDGQTCQPLNGCSCIGDCGQLQETYDDCVKIHAPCSDPGPQCKSDAECPAPAGPCQVCADGSTACPVGVCTNGQCSVQVPACGPDCGPDDAAGIGSCKKLLGFGWNGKDCLSITGCECQGADCKALEGSYDACIAAHKECIQPASPCSGKKCGDVCSTCPPGELCPPVVEYCDVNGKCIMEKPVCTFP